MSLDELIDPYPVVAPEAFGRPLTGIAHSGAEPALGSVIVPAHNEAAVIVRCLGALFSNVRPGELDVVVVCNGCQDDTAQRARDSGHPVRVIELATASKAAALRAGDAATDSFPRLYLDADVLLDGASALRIIARLASGAVAARPPVRYECDRSVTLVRSYYRARAQMPAVMHSLWGAGVYGVSAAGRARFAEFPSLGADDLWIDGQFDSAEIDVVMCEPVRVAVPRRSRDLLHTLHRTYRGKDETRVDAASARRSRRTTARVIADLARLSVRRPMAACDVMVYVGFAVTARVMRTPGRIRRAPGSVVWERDDSSRVGLS